MSGADHGATINRKHGMVDARLPSISELARRSRRTPHSPSKPNLRRDWMYTYDHVKRAYASLRRLIGEITAKPS